MKMLFAFLSFIFLLLTTAAYSTTCHPNDLTALLAIKSSFTNTTRFSSWIPKRTACCNWYGLSCNNKGRIKSLSIFQDDNLTGSIPPAIGNLTSLTSLTLHRLPNLVGQIPDQLSGLTNLTLLDLSRNSLSGRIPLFLSSLRQLAYLDLSHNLLSSQIPATLSSLHHLRTLRLHRNLLYGTLPNTFSNFPRSSPPDLYLSHNLLTGVIWPSLGDPDWRVIDLSGNKLMGDASVLFGEGKKAVVIDVSDNRFEFELSGIEFPRGLKVLNLSRNMISGSVPEQINEVHGLEVFDVSRNEVCGEIPAGSVTARFGKEAYVPHLCLCGPPLDPCN